MECDKFNTSKTVYFSLKFPAYTLIIGRRKSLQLKSKTDTVELQWLEHLGNHENMFEIGVVRANEC